MEHSCPSGGLLQLAGPGHVQSWETAVTGPPALAAPPGPGRPGVPVAATSAGREGGVRPVGRRDGRAVLPRARLVEHRQQLGSFVRQGLEVDHGVRAVAVVRVEDEIAVEVARVEAGQGEAVTW